jgi:hypothetical protein
MTHPIGGQEPLRYGEIVAIDRRRRGNARCWLTDPPPADREREPASARLIQRVRFLRDWISFVAPRSPFAASLATRTAALEALQDPLELDGVELRRGDGEVFSFGAYAQLQPHSTFFASRSRIQDSPAGGVVLRFSDQALIFLGFRQDLLTLAARQDFGQISEYSAPAATIHKVVECVVSVGRVRTLALPASIRNAASTSGGYLTFTLEGRMHYSRGGLIFGELPLSKE